MKASPHPAETAVTVDMQVLKAIKQRFQKINRLRLERVRESLRPRQRVFLDLLPLLFHINHPLLPGYVSRRTPAGIPDYSPPRHAVEEAHRLAKGYGYRRRAYRVFHLEGLYLMGSCGTVAYSDKSDFDIWVCHRPGLGQAQRTALRSKATRIQEWAGSLGLEVHIFVIDPERFRRGEHEALSKESSGAIQHHLLLEEFYRTGLLLAGRYPAWWLVPPDREREYEKYVHMLLERRFVRPAECVDLGPVLPVPAGEFFGAALWQLYKAVDSPYKSVLKILLMESYAAEYPDLEPLCQRFKQAVYEGETNPDRLDPYVLMCRKVEGYLEARGDRERLELARRCFYFKVNERLSTPPNGAGGGWRRRIQQALVDEWGWDRARLLMLDARPSWKIHRVLEERAILADQLIHSYRTLSSFARTRLDSPAASADLDLLARRLHSAFERRAGKVEIINPGISESLVEEEISLHHRRDHGEDAWLLFRGAVGESEARRTAPLKRARSLVELLAWCHFNRIMDEHTVMRFHAPESHLAPAELHAVIEVLRCRFPGGRLPESDLESLRRPARVTCALLFINVGVDPMARHTRQGMQLTSNRTDPLSYGGGRENLARTFDLLVLTSWQEILTLHYHGDAGLMDCLGEYLAWAPLDEAAAPPAGAESTARASGHTLQPPSAAPPSGARPRRPSSTPPSPLGTGEAECAGVSGQDGRCRAPGTEPASRADRLAGLIPRPRTSPLRGPAFAAPPPVSAFSFSSPKGEAIAGRVEALFRSVISCFYQRPGGRDARYVLQLGSGYCILQAENHVPRATRAESYRELVHLLERPQASFSPVVIDPQALADTPLPAIYRANRPGIVQLFYRVHRNEAEVLILDEHGSLFRQMLPYHDSVTLLRPYRRFLDAVHRRRQLINGDPRGDAGEAVEFYRIERSGSGVVREAPPGDDHAERYIRLQVLGQPGPDGRLRFTLYCDDREFSHLEFGEGVFREAALYILARRAHGARYPIYITDMDLPRTVLSGDSAGPVQTVHFLRHKRRIEARLNGALEAMSADGAG